MFHVVSLQYIALFEPGHVLKMFLVFYQFEPQCSYKRVLIKKNECTLAFPVFFVA